MARDLDDWFTDDRLFKYLGSNEFIFIVKCRNRKLRKEREKY